MAAPPPGGGPPRNVGGRVARRTGVARDATLDGLPARAVAAAFALDQGESEVIGLEDGAAILRVDGVTVPGGTSEEDLRAKEALSRAAGQGIAQDISQAFSAALEAQKGISLNSSAVNAVLSQLN